MVVLQSTVVLAFVCKDGQVIEYWAMMAYEENCEQHIEHHEHYITHTELTTESMTKGERAQVCGDMGKKW